MKNSFVYLFGMLTLCGCFHKTSNVVTDSSRYAVIVVDGKHQVFPTNQKRIPYETDAASGIRLDAGHFQFTEGSVAVAPDMVEVRDFSHIYRLAQPIVTNVFVLDASTLNAVHGSAFAGFRSGHNYLVGVGRATPRNMVADWVGIITVK
jgi:hypothetical protein